MSGLVQVPESRGRRQLRPDRLDDPLAMERMLRRQSQQLDEVRAAPRPRVVGDGASVDGDPEATEQLDLDELHRTEMFPRIRRAMRSRPRWQTFNTGI